MTDTNTIIITGRLTRDAETKNLTTGTELTRFSIAVNRSVKRGDNWTDEVSFFDVEKWKAGGLAPLLAKGKQVIITGTLEQDRWEKEGQKRSKVKIVANQIQLIGSKADNATNEQPQQEDEEIPF